MEKEVELHIPPSFIKGTNIKDGKFIVTPAVEHKYSLTALRANVTQENLNGEVDWGDAIRKEVWRWPSTPKSTYLLEFKI